jgi:hypothetical protein
MEFSATLFFLSNLYLRKKMLKIPGATSNRERAPRTLHDSFPCYFRSCNTIDFVIVMFSLFWPFVPSDIHLLMASSISTLVLYACIRLPSKRRFPWKQRCKKWIPLFSIRISILCRISRSLTGAILCTTKKCNLRLACARLWDWFWWLLYYLSPWSSHDAKVPDLSSNLWFPVVSSSTCKSESSGFVQSLPHPPPPLPFF